MLNGEMTLFLDQYGNPYWAKTLEELRSKCAGRVSKMYVDKKDGTSVWCGYVIGNRWLTAYRPIELPAD